MVALARKTLIYEWRRFLPAAVAVAFSGLLLLMQAALMLGIFGSAAVYINQSGGDLWVGYPGTQSIELGRPIPRDTEMRLLMDSSVRRVEPFQWIDADWRGPADRGGLSVFVSGIDAHADGLMYARVLNPSLRQRLLEPDSVIVDRADLPKLGLKIGDSALINGRRVHLVGVGSGLRALGGINVLSSVDTARRLDNDHADTGQVAYYVLQLADPTTAESVAKRLSAGSGGRYAVWTREAFANRAVDYWMFGTGAGLGVLFLSAVVLVAGAVITSQTLMGAVAGSIREYATLRALGVSIRGLRAVVLEQAGWVGVCGLLAGMIVGAFALLLARSEDVPVELTLLSVVLCSVLVMGVALLSGLLAVRSLRRADPATLMR
ncbi:MAG TPA: FtsX-like permease family protein [Xanthomonadaceae bacterium]|nr:FtsX-like permease family protein [Xanthomonadaceae bacterium]